MLQKKYNNACKNSKNIDKKLSKISQKLMITHIKV